MAYVPTLQELIRGDDSNLPSLDELVASAPPKKPEPKTDWTKLPNQAGAGVADLLNIPAYAALVGHGLDAVVPNNPVTGAIQSALDSAAGSVSTGINEAFNVDDPDTIPESAARLLSALTPTGALKKIATKALPAAVVSNKAAQVAGHVADYTILPGVVGDYTKTNAALNFAVPFGIEQAVNEYYVEDKTGMPKETIFDFLPGADPATNIPVPTNVTGTLQVDLPYAMPPDLYAKIREQEIMDGKDETDWQLKALGGLAVLGGVQAFRSYTHGARLRRETVKAGGNPQPQTVVGDPQTPQTVVERAATTESATTPLEAFATQNQDSQFIIGSQVERATGDADYAQDVSARIRQQVGSNSTSAIKQTMDSGELHYTFAEFQNGQMVERTGTLNMPKFADWKLEYDNLSPVERETYGKGRFAADAWDNRQVARQITGDASRAPSATNWSDTELRQYMQDLEANPKLKALADAEKQMYDTLLKFQLESGRISAAQYRQMRGERPNYMYNMLPDEASRSADEAIDYSPQKLYQRTDETGQGAQEIMNPVAAMETYMNQTIRAAKTNAMQREVIDALTTSTDPVIRASLQQVRKPDKPNTVLDPATHVTIYRNGVEQVYEFADPLMVSSLRLAPYAAKHTWWNMQRKIAQQLNTGLLQPLFAPVAASMDAFITTVARSPDREFGILDRLSRSLTGDRVGVKGDPTALLLAAHGVGRGVAHRFAKGLSDNIYNILAADSPITRVLDPNAMRSVADRMRNYYLMSDTAILRENGVFNSSYLADARFGFKKMASENFGAAGQVFRAYTAMIDSIHQGSKLSFFSQNYYRLAKRHGGFDKIPRRELTKLLEESASSSGNLSLTGLGSRSKPVIQKTGAKQSAAEKAGTNQTFAAVNEWMSNALPYFNVQKQSLTHIGKQFYQNPAHVTAGVVTAIGLPVVMMHLMMDGQGQEYSDYYWNKLPAWKRSMHMYFPIPGKPPEEGVLVPVPHELSLMKALIEGGLDQAFGFANGRIASDEFADIKASLNNYFSVFVPPALSGGAALMGKQINAGIGFGASPIEVRDVQTETLSGDANKRNVSSVLSANTEAFIQGLFGVTGSQFIESLNAAYAQEKEFDLADFGEEYISQQKQKGASRFGGWLYPGKEYTGTVASNELYEKKQLIERFNNVWNRMRGAGYVGGLRDPVELQGALPPEVTNERFKAAAPIIYEATMKKGVYKDLAKARNQADKQIQSLRGVYPKTETVIKQLNAWTLQKNDLTEKMVLELQTLEKQLGVKLEDLDPYAEN